MTKGQKFKYYVNKFFGTPIIICVDDKDGNLGVLFKFNYRHLMIKDNEVVLKPQFRKQFEEEFAENKSKIIEVLGIEDIVGDELLKRGLKFNNGKKK